MRERESWSENERQRGERDGRRGREREMGKGGNVAVGAERRKG